MLSTLVVIGAFLMMAGAERLWSLRHCAEPAAPRAVRNIGIWAISAAILAVLDRPVTSVVARWSAAEGIGLLHAVALPASARLVAGLLLLDYMSFVWHRLLHQVPVLWRFHEVHHADLDVDASTALRFHAGEAVLSVPWRCALIITIGIDPPTLALWHVTLFLSVLFHHSNVALPLGLERALGLILVTPRLHGVHHATAAELMGSNYSSGLTLWDRLHRTFRGAPFEPVTLGMMEMRSPKEVGFIRMIGRPFERRRA